MMRFSASAKLVAAGSVLLVGCNQGNSAAVTPAANTETEAAVDHSDPIASAMAAAPKTIAKDATIVQAAADGSMKQLRAGSNGWTCMPDNPKTPGHDPMCMDANAMRWAEAWMTRKTPPADNVGLMYMLAGGSDASNMDPYGENPANGKWVETGPHVMVVGSDSLNKIYPATADPDTAKPYVMFGGTPYAHMMIPVK